MFAELRSVKKDWKGNRRGEGEKTTAHELRRTLVPVGRR
jgi:hypothetical protein